MAQGKTWSELLGLCLLLAWVEDEEGLFRQPEESEATDLAKKEDLPLGLHVKLLPATVENLDMNDSGRSPKTPSQAKFVPLRVWAVFAGTWNFDKTKFLMPVLFETNAAIWLWYDLWLLRDVIANNFSKKSKAEKSMPSKFADNSFLSTGNETECKT